MSHRCPSDLALEGYLLDRETSALASHVAGCAGCQARVSRMEQEGQNFLRYVYPATVSEVEQAAARQRRSAWRRWLLVLPVPVAAALVAVLLTGLPRSRAPAGPAEGYLGVKGGGGGLGLSVFLGAAEGARLVTDGEEVPASSALRFKIQPTRACHLWVVSVDTTGLVSRLYPSAGEGGAEIAHGGALPGGAVLDGRGGPERIFAICTPAPTLYSQLESAVRRAVGRGEEAVRNRRDVPGFPDGTIQASVLIHKAR
jgi:hypothetical protein